MGFVPKGGAELELYLFDETYDVGAGEALRTTCVPFGHYIEDYHISPGHSRGAGRRRAVRALGHSGVPMEGSKGEWGPGQQEINLRVRRALLSRRTATCSPSTPPRRSRTRKGLAVTFMAKWDERFAGSGLHVSTSRCGMRRRSERLPGRRAARERWPCADAFRWFLGGLLAHARRADRLLGALRSTPTSGSRARSFAPTTIAWSYDNRTAGFRVVGERTVRCASSAASREPTRTRTSSGPRPSPRDSTGSAGRDRAAAALPG